MLLTQVSFHCTMTMIWLDIRSHMVLSATESQTTTLMLQYDITKCLIKHMSKIPKEEDDFGLGTFRSSLYTVENLRKPLKK